MTTAISNGETGFSVRTKINGIWEGLELNAIAESKAVTAVDVFVYDTSKDSDGGAWRKRTQHTSWYNETLNTATRGSRREFPAVAVIVAETGKVTIYDGDDPALPMWMVFGLGVGSLLTSFNSVSMRNGIMCAGSPASINYSGLLVARFLNDDAIGVRGHVYWNLHKNISSIAGRNTQTYEQTGARGFLAYASSSVLVNPSVNDVAMTVLPDAPIDPATGLQVPTIYAFTAGGVSRIADDGTVSSTASAAVPEGGIFEDQVWATFVSVGQTYFGSLPVSETLPTGGALNAPYYWRSGKTNTYDLYVDGIEPSISDDAFGLSTGLHSFDYSPADNSTSMLAITTSTYNTGWLPGDIKGAFLSDTDDTDLVGSGELVTNGDFATDVSGWTVGSTSTFTWNASGYADLDRNFGAAYEVYQDFSTVVGQRYLATADVLALSNGAGINVAGIEVSRMTAGKLFLTFVATSTTTRVYLGATQNTSATASFDNISVKLADADRSVNG